VERDVVDDARARICMMMMNHMGNSTSLDFTRKEEGNGGTRDPRNKLMQM